jgi:peptidoglycan/LPS O-acetylase OafA/YrhL
MDFSAVHVHLAINHSPLYGELFAFCLVLFGLIKKRREFVTAGLVVCILAALLGIWADTTGDGAAHFISHANPPIAGVDKTLIKEHDLAASFFVGGSCITGFVAIIALFIGHRRGTRPRWLEVVMAILIAWSLSIAGRTALLGGRIHHEEVRALAVHTP